MNKILRTLRKCWEPKVTIIQEVQELKTLPLHHLLGFLITHEMILGEEASKKKKGNACKDKRKVKESLQENSTASSIKMQMQENKKEVNKKGRN